MTGSINSGESQDIATPETNSSYKTYIGCKIIKATPISYEDFAKEKGIWKEGQETMGNGYKVVYPDNYISFSPKNVFEEAYREVSNGEYKLLLQ